MGAFYIVDKYLNCMNQMVKLEYQFNYPELLGNHRKSIFVAENLIEKRI